jgi:hypothetical protein
VWHDVGQGKTRTGLSVVATLQILNEWELPFIVVVVCRRKAFHTWEDEIALLGLNYYVYRWDPKAEEHDYDDERPTVWLVSEGQVDQFWINPYVRHIIVDELHLFKNPAAIRSRAVQKLARNRPITGLSGSIMTANNIEDLYGQAWAVGVQQHLCKTFTDFRSEFMISLPKEGNSPPIKTPKRGAYTLAMNRLEPFVDVYFPEKKDRRIVESIIKVPLTDQQKEYLYKLKEHWEIEEIEYNNAAAITVKSQQISDGWVKVDDHTAALSPGGGGRSWITDIETNKVEYLIGLLEEILDTDHKCVVWCAFKYDLDYLAARLPFATLQQSGQQPLDLEKWRSGKFPIVLATEGSGSAHNDYAQVPYGIYYSQSWKWLDMQQSQGRHDRKSSKHDTCYYYYLHTQGTLDKYIYDKVKYSSSQEKSVIQSGEIAQWVKEK